jgi:hypothetical protein
MPNFDRKAIDAARKMNGNQPPLTDEEFASLQGNGQSDEEKAAQLQLQQEEEARKKAEEEKNKQPEPKVFVADDVTDDLLLESLRRRGISVASVEDLKQQEVVDRERAAEERESEKLAWGLKNKKLKQKEYEGFIAASKDPRSVVYNLRLQAAKKEDPNLDETEFKDEFEEEFGLTSKPETRRYKNGQDTLNRLAEAALKNTYSSVYNLENEYSGYEQSEKSKRADQAKITAEAPQYKKTIDNIRSKLKKIKTKLTDTDEYEVDVVDESINEVMDMISDPVFASQQILKGYTEDDLQDMAFTVLLKKNWPVFANEMAKQHLKKHAAGTKGILTLNGHSAAEVEGNLTDQQKVLKNLIEQNKTVPANAN